MSASTTTFEWTLERFPDSRLATNVVENPRALIAALFGIPEDDLPDTIPSVATYEAVFDTIQHCIVDTEKALIAMATEAVQSVVERVEAAQRLNELARYDAQLATLHLGAELLYHATCRNDPQAADLIKKWAPEKVWEFLDLAEAMPAEVDLMGWKRAEFSPSSSVPPVPQLALPKLMSVPLRSTAAIPSRRATKPYPERDWFRKRSSALATKVAQRLTKDKQGLTRLLTEGAGEVSEAAPAGTSAVDSQLSEEAGRGLPERGSDADSDSESEPEASGDVDPLDPEPNFRKHPNAWRLWVARTERRRTEKARGPTAVASASSARSGPTKPPLPRAFSGADGDVDRFIGQLTDYFSLTRVKEDLDKIHTAGMLCDGKAGHWYETYRLKIDKNMAMRKLGRWVEDPLFKTWDHFERTLRDSHGGRPRRQKDVNKWNNLRQTGGIDAFLDEVTRLMWVMDYPDNVVKDKLRDGLKRDLRKEWSKVRPKPDSLAEQITMLRDLGHADEDFDREEADRTRDQDRQSGRRDRDRDRRRNESPGRRRDGRRPDHHSRPDKSRSGKREKASSSSASRSGRERGNKPSGSSSFQQATRGIDSEVIAERRKNGDCLKCGKSGHSWNDCWAKEPNGSSGSSDKRKGDNDSRGSSSFKKAKTSAAAAAAVTSEPGRIIEIPEDEAEDLDFDIWG
jgi:hypothetical protein